MQTRRILGVAALGVSSLVLAAGPALAQDATVTTTYSTIGEGTALKLGAFGQSTTFGHSLVTSDSTPAAAAEGAGLLSPLGNFGESSASASKATPTAGSADPTCGGESADIPGLTLALGCSTALASVSDTETNAAASGAVSDIVVNPIDAISTTPLGDVISQIGGTLGDLIDNLDPLTQGIQEGSGGALGVDDTIDTLIDELFGGADLVKLQLGETSTSTTTVGDQILTRCHSEGARIAVLDPEAISDVDPDPVMTIIVGPSTAEVTVNKLTGVATPVVLPALVTVEAPTLLQAPIEIPIGQTIDPGLPDPLTSIIVAADGQTGEEDGMTFARTSAVRIELLATETFQGGIELLFSDCAVAAGAKTTSVSPEVLTPTTAAPAALPRTGGGAAGGAVPILGALGIAGLGAALLRRTSASLTD